MHPNLDPILWNLPKNIFNRYAVLVTWEWHGIMVPIPLLSHIKLILAHTPLVSHIPQILVLWLSRPLVCIVLNRKYWIVDRYSWNMEGACPGLVSDHFWARQSDSDDDFFKINSKSIQIYWKTVQIYSELVR